MTHIYIICTPLCIVFIYTDCLHNIHYLLQCTQYCYPVSLSTTMKCFCFCFVSVSFLSCVFANIFKKNAQIRSNFAFVSHTIVSGNFFGVVFVALQLLFQVLIDLIMAYFASMHARETLLFRIDELRYIFAVCVVFLVFIIHGC